MSYRMALITGASSGIGAAMARALPLETGLLLTARDEGRLRKLAAELAVPGRRIEIVAADLADESGRDLVIEHADRAAIDFIAYSAGVGWQGDFLDTRRHHARETVAVNVIAPTELLHALLPGMVARAKESAERAGLIVVSSMAAFNAMPGLASYAASKSFQLQLVQGLARELKKDPIDILALCPTYTRTEFFSRGGLPEPEWAMSADAVARAGLAALGRRPMQVFGRRQLPQPILQLVAFNPMILPWRWPRRFASGLLRWWRLPRRYGERAEPRR